MTPEETYRQACRLTSDIRDKIRQEKAAIKNRYQAIIDAECYAVDGKYDAELSIAFAAECFAQKAFDAAKVAAMQDAKLGGVAIGGRVRLWKREYSCVPWRSTDQLGIVELCTHDSKFPANQSYSTPGVGDLFVRLLKKDGTPSLKFERGGWSSDSLPYGWYPEGAKPK